MNDRCPMMMVEYVWPPEDPDAQEQVPLAARPCDAELHLVWMFDIPVASDNTEPIPAKDVAEWANTDCWEVVCENGHKLALSSGEENAEPFDFAITFGDSVAGEAHTPHEKKNEGAK